MWISARAKLILAGLAALALVGYLVLIWIRAGGEIGNRPRAPQPESIPAPYRGVTPEKPSSPPVTSESPPAGGTAGERVPPQAAAPQDADRRPRRRGAERAQSPAPNAADGASVSRQPAPQSANPLAPADLPGPAPSAPEPSRTAPVQADAKPSVAQRPAAPQREKPPVATDLPAPAPAPPEPPRTAPAQTEAGSPAAANEPSPVLGGQGGTTPERPRMTPSPVQKGRSARQVIPPTPQNTEGVFKPSLSEGTEGSVPDAEGATSTDRLPALRRERPAPPADLPGVAPGPLETFRAAPAEADGGPPSASHEPPPVSGREGLTAPKRFRAPSGPVPRTTRSPKRGMPVIGVAERPIKRPLRPNFLWRRDVRFELECRCVVVGWRLAEYGVLLAPQPLTFTAMPVANLRGGWHPYVAGWLGRRFGGSP